LDGRRDVTNWRIGLPRTKKKWRNWLRILLIGLLLGSLGVVGGPSGEVLDVLVSVIRSYWLGR
jgi:hypothetical protein